MQVAPSRIIVGHPHWTRSIKIHVYWLWLATFVLLFSLFIVRNRRDHCATKNHILQSLYYFFRQSYVLEIMKYYRSRLCAVVRALTCVCSQIHIRKDISDVISGVCTLSNDEFLFDRVNNRFLRAHNFLLIFVERFKIFLVLNLIAYGV